MVACYNLQERRLSSEINNFIRGKEGHEIGELIDHLSSIGDCAIFGGLPRDFARQGRNAFSSDVDIVVDCASSDLDALLKWSGDQRNRFGGYRLKLGRFDFDVWALQTTWAAKAGLVEVYSLADLIKTTFFDCDAILYHCRTKEISRSDRFWKSIESGVVDINLENNPHYIDTIIRTLKIIFNRREKVAPRLAGYLVECIMYKRDELMDYAVRNDIRLGKYSEIKVDAALSLLDQRIAKSSVIEMCMGSIIGDYELSIENCDF